jgi:hypothetical protein
MSEHATQLDRLEELFVAVRAAANEGLRTLAGIRAEIDAVDAEEAQPRTGPVFFGADDEKEPA